MFSQTTEYALRAMVCLADSDQIRITTRQIAERAQVPPNYLSKVIQALVRAGLAQSQRGLHGGCSLARPAGEIRLLEIINAVEPLIHIKKCPLNLKQHDTSLCPLHRKLENAVCQIEAEFNATTLESLQEDSSRPESLCKATE